MSIALELKSVDASYGEMKVLFGVNLLVPTGSVVALLGANGAGKSTTLRVAAGLLRPGAGQLLLHGNDVTGARPRALSRRGLCLIPEGRGIFPNLTVRENLVIHTHLRGRRAMAQVEERAFSTFPILSNRAGQVAGTLSGGEQQMLALSRALTTEPSVLLLDEISMGLAPLIVEELFDVVRQMAATGVTIVLVEQLVDDALQIADYVVLLNQGIVTGVGQPADINERIAASYLGETALVDAPAADVSVPSEHLQRNDASSGTLLATERGTLSHLASCMIVMDRKDLRTAGPAFPRCGMCQPDAGPEVGAGQLGVMRDVRSGAL
jgi:branched-chain amino acid transport system ATP-binding protein